MPISKDYGFSPNTKEEWLELVKKDLKGKDFDSTLKSSLWEEIEISPIYFHKDIGAQNNPTSFHPKPDITGFSPRNWTNLVSIYPKDSKTSNTEILDLLNKGAEGLVLHLNGNEDLVVLLDQVLPQYISIYFLPESNTDLVFEAIKTYISDSGIKEEQLHGGIIWAPTLDIPHHSENIQWQLCSDLLNFFRNYKGFHPIMIDFVRYADAGASGIQELTFGLSELIENLDILTDKDFSPRFLFQKIGYFTAVGNEYFPEIAKLKALRFLLCELALQYGVELSTAQIHLLVTTSNFTKSLLNSETNLIRQTYETMSGILGGANSLWVRPILGSKSSELEKRMSRNISIILSEESYLGKVLDPASGSYFLEYLQKELAETIRYKVKEIEIKGGWKSAFESGFIPSQVKDRRVRIQSEILDNQLSKVGVNRYKQPEDQLKVLEFKEIQEDSNRLVPSRASYLVELEKFKKS